MLVETEAIADLEVMMSKKVSSSETSVKLQIPVKPWVAKEIAELAGVVEQSQSWMAAQLLEVTLQSRKDFGKWMLDQFLSKATKAVMSITGRTVAGGGEDDVVRLQVTLRESMAKEIAEQGSPIGHTQTRMAGFLLEGAVTENKWIIEAVHSRPGLAFMEMVIPELKKKNRRRKVATKNRRATR